ncbi:MAG: circadian clock KaiB family protein [Cyanobacteria bacterium P01_E01_bin.42]
MALFTPAGDLIYAIDPSKQGKWHANLCIGLQELLGLPEPPHFLVPAYTATVDRWLDPRTREVRTIAEAYPAVMRYQTLLDAIFATQGVSWQQAEWQEEACEPLIIESYRDRFPQLWEERDLVVAYDRWQRERENRTDPNSQAIVSEAPAFNYVLRLFVSGNTSTTEQTLKILHQLLETRLHSPYTLKVIDIFKHPEQAELNHVSATPTLVRAWPHPVRRIVGELEDLERVLQVIRMS